MQRLLVFCKLTNKEFGSINACRKIIWSRRFSYHSLGAPRIYFAGVFTAGQSKITVSDNKLPVTEDGITPKFVDSVHKVVCSGHQEVKYMQEALPFHNQIGAWIFGQLCGKIKNFAIRTICHNYLIKEVAFLC